MWLLILRVVGVFALAAVFVGFGAVEVIVEACLLLLRHFQIADRILLSPVQIIVLDFIIVFRSIQIIVPCLMLLLRPLKAHFLLLICHNSFVICNWLLFFSVIFIFITLVLDWLHHLLLPFLNLLEIEIPADDIRHFLLTLILVDKNNTASTKLHHFYPEDVMHIGAVVVQLYVVVADIIIKLEHLIIVLNHLELPND